MKIDRTGQIFGRLTVISFDRKQGKNDRWNCRCECGTERSFLINCLIRRISPTRSCGCYRRESTASHRFKHGHSVTGRPRSALYRAWMNMKDRCDNPNNKDYHNYGGRNISYCKRWDMFDGFLSDMEPHPGRNFSLDRIDTNGNYSKDNCRWATPIEQGANRRNVTLLTVDGESKTISQWAKATGVMRQTIASRLKLGIPPHIAIIRGSIKHVR